MDETQKNGHGQDERERTYAEAQRAAANRAVQKQLHREVPFEDADDLPTYGDGMVNTDALITRLRNRFEGGIKATSDAPQQKPSRSKTKGDDFEI